jgi:hypothetical protein
MITMPKSQEVTKKNFVKIGRPGECDSLGLYEQARGGTAKKKFDDGPHEGRACWKT